jgi:SAM-dependent methyltransferase
VTIDYDQIAAAYARHRQVHPGVFRSLAEVVQPSSRVLEVGCGTGNYILALQAHCGCTCWGIDPSREMLDIARNRAENVHFQQERAEAVGMPPTSLDLVFSVDVIHHITDRPVYYREAYRLLAPQGRICTVTDSAWIIRHRQPLSTYFPETVEYELARYPRIDSLREMMIDAGFDEIDESTVESSYMLTDIQIYRDKAFSALHLISERAFARGIARMEQELNRGPLPCIARYTLLWGTKGR